MRGSTRALIGAALALGLGGALLAGGAGTLASWTDTATSEPQAISSGSLDLGTIGTGDLQASLFQRVAGAPDTLAVPYTGQALVPGDVLRIVVDVPVRITGQNMRARLDVAPSLTAASSATPADARLADALDVAVVSVGGAAAATSILSPTSVAGGTVPVTLEVTFPWGTTSQYNDAVGGRVDLDASYTLTQVPAGEAG